jgi:hypothetical protein
VTVTVTNPTPSEIMVKKVFWNLDDLSLSAEKEVSVLIRPGRKEAITVKKYLGVSEGTKNSENVTKIMGLSDLQVTVEVTLIKVGETVKLTAKARLPANNC